MLWVSFVFLAALRLSGVQGLLIVVASFVAEHGL